MYIPVYPKKIVLLCIILLICITAETKKEDYITHQIKPGESVSLICIDYYGNYSNKMGDAIKNINPSINDINLIIAGGQIKLRKPQAPSKKKGTAPAIFAKKVNITQGVVTCVVGKALLLKKGGKKKTRLATNTLVLPGDKIFTGSDGRVEVIINRESVLRMKENTHLTLGEYRSKEEHEGKTNVDLKKGTIWTKIKKFADKICRFELSLPTAIAGVYGTIYETSVAEDSTTEVKVYNGEVSVKGTPQASVPTGGEITEVPGPSEVPGPHEVTMDEWVRIVRSMQKVTIDKNGTPSEVSAFKKDPSSSWEKWNEERDQLIAAILSEK